jgi:hypothetical protein
LLLQKENEPRKIDAMTNDIVRLRKEIKLAQLSIADTRRGLGFTTARQTHVPSTSHIPHRNRSRRNTGFGDTRLSPRGSPVVQETHNGRPVSNSPSTHQGAGAQGPGSKVPRAVAGINSGNRISFEQAGEGLLSIAIDLSDTEEEAALRNPSRTRRRGRPTGTKNKRGKKNK